MQHFAFYTNIIFVNKLFKWGETREKWAWLLVEKGIHWQSGELTYSLYMCCLPFSIIKRNLSNNLDKLKDLGLTFSRVAVYEIWFVCVCVCGWCWCWSIYPGGSPVWNSWLHACSLIGSTLENLLPLLSIFFKVLSKPSCSPGEKCTPEVWNESCRIPSIFALEHI